jgi:hypothetical protein
MLMSPAVPSRVRCALLVAALVAAPALLSAQARAGVTRRVELVMVTAPSVRVRTAPSGSSLSIEDVGKGTVFHVAADDYQTKDWIGVVLDGRIAFVPRDAVAPRAYGARTSLVEEAPVTQAGSPTPSAPAPMTASAPAQAVASQPLPAEPAPRPAVSQAPAPVEAPRVASAMPRVEPTATQMVVNAPTGAPDRQPEPAPAVKPARADSAAAPARDRENQSSRFRVPRPSFGLTVGAFGSFTPIKTAGVPTAAHVAGLSFIGMRFGMLGIYGAPEFGQGGGYKSTMIGGGGALHLLRLHPLHVTLLGGVANYSETTIPTDSTVAPVTRSLQGTSVGGMVSIPFIGPLRLGYRGQYFMTKNAGVAAQMTRHYAGLVF